MPIWAWILFNIFVLFVLAIDLFFHKKEHVIKQKEAWLWTGVWVTLALIFNLFIYLTMGKEPALNFLTGYLIEKSLSIDNLFVFVLIFQYFRTPPETVHKVLFWGILGAIVMRALFIFLGVTLIQEFHWIIYLFGLFLIITGVRFWFDKKKDIHPEKNPIIKFFQKIMGVVPEYHGDKFFIIRKGKRLATPLFLVLLSIETTDIVFAIDSIPAILAITTDPFIVYTSNIFAILGLRALFFVLADMIRLFHTLHYGIALILIFIGLKMLLENVIVIPTLFALGFIFATILCSILLSKIIPKEE